MLVISLGLECGRPGLGEGTLVRRFLSVGENSRALVFSVEMEGGGTGDSICRYQRQ